MNSKPWLAWEVTQQKQPATLCDPSVISVTLSREDMEGGQRYKTEESYSRSVSPSPGLSPGAAATPCLLGGGRWWGETSVHTELKGHQTSDFIVIIIKEGINFSLWTTCRQKKKMQLQTEHTAKLPKKYWSSSEKVHTSKNTRNS